MKLATSELAISASVLNKCVLATMLATLGAGAIAQSVVSSTPATPVPASQAPSPAAAPRRGHPDPAQMQAFAAKRQAALKAKLNITPAQESLWSTYTAAMQAPRRDARPTPEQRAALDKLPTPQRIDKIKEMRSQRIAEMTAAMDKRDEITKAFYAALTPQQQKVFDAEHAQPQHAGLDPQAGAGDFVPR